MAQPTTVETKQAPIKDIPVLDMTSDKSGHTGKFVLSVMEINQGASAQAVLNSLYSMFGEAKVPSLSDPLANEKASSSIIQKVEDFTTKLGDLATQRVDNPESIHKKVTWMYLPLPVNIEENFTQQYEESQFSLEEKLLKSGAGVAINALGRINSNIPTAFNDLVGFTESYLKRNNITVNQNIISTYAGTVPRNVSLIFNFIPENEAHARRIKRGIRLLKSLARATSKSKHITPSATNSTETKQEDKVPSSTNSMASANTSSASTASVPGTIEANPVDFDALFLSQKYIVTFQLSVDKSSEDKRRNILLLNNALSTKSNTSTLGVNGQEKELSAQVSPGFFIQDVIVEYGKDGYMSTYNDKMPKHIQLTLSLIERAPMYSKNFEGLYKQNSYINNTSRMI